jgi:hypothetical protein
MLTRWFVREAAKLMRRPLRAEPHRVWRPSPAPDPLPLKRAA